MSGHKWVYFGIPYTDEQMTSLVQKESKRLCFEQGSCSADLTGILLSTIGIPAGGALSALATGFNFVKAIARGDTVGAAQEMGTEVLGPVIDDAIGIGGLTGGVDVVFDLASLSESELEWADEAFVNVQYDIAQAEQAFYAPMLLNSGPMTVAPLSVTPAFYSFPWHSQTLPFLQQRGN